MAIHFYSSFDFQKKKEIRAVIMTILDSRRKQKEDIEKNILKPVNDSIELCHSVLKSGGISFEEFQMKQGQISKHIMKLFEEMDKNDIL